MTICNHSSTIALDVAPKHESAFMDIAEGSHVSLDKLTNGAASGLTVVTSAGRKHPYYRSFYAACEGCGEIIYFNIGWSEKAYKRPSLVHAGAIA